MENSEHRRINEFSDQTAEVPGGNIKEEAPGGREPSQKGLTRESVENVGNIPLPSEPFIGPETEFIVKQEWIE